MRRLNVLPTREALEVKHSPYWSLVYLALMVGACLVFAWALAPSDVESHELLVLAVFMYPIFTLTVVFMAHARADAIRYAKEHPMCTTCNGKGRL